MEDSTWDVLGATRPTPAGTAADSAPGAVFGRFVTTGMLGRGGMGVVMAGYDPELDRKVALKLLHPEGDVDGEARARLHREAQAMARLAHPNVVTVYEVGRTDEHLFIAMELVEGTTLRRWLDARRGWREIVAMFVAAGRGLEAAHRAGIVHRDFKPENVLIGNDSRPRVGDFGLAETGARAGRMPLDGLAVGTPAYMAPEQWRGDTVDARADQFAFCVALWAALWRQQPFDGDESSTLREQVLAGRRREPPTRTGVPGWLEAALERGLAIEPAERWPNLGDLLDEIEGRMSTRRLVATAVVASGALAAAAIGVAIVMAARSTPDPCAPPADRLAAVWSTARRAALADHTAAIDPTFGAKRFAAASAVLDRGAAAWSDVHVSACRATRVEGRQSDSLLDLRMKCLDRWLVGFGGLAGDLEKAQTPAQLEGALVGMTALVPLDRCNDATALQAELPPPDAPAARAESDAIITEVRAIQDARHAGKLAGLKERGEAVLARARKLDHPPTLVKALGVRWRLAVASQDLPAAIAGLREDVEVASRAHDGDEETKAWALQVRLLGRFLGHPDEARAIMPAARAACARAGDPPLLRTEVLSDEAEALSAAGDTDHALADLAEAQQLLVKLGADQPGSAQAPTLGGIQHTLATTYYDAGQLDRAVAAIKDAIATYDRAYGPDTIESAAAWLDLAQFERDSLHYDAAQEAVLRAVHIRETRDGESPALAQMISVQAEIAGRRGNADNAVMLAERAVAMSRKGGHDPMFVLLQASLADTYADAGRKREALATYDEVLASAERDHMMNTNVAGWWINRADIARGLGDCKNAITSYRKGGAVGEQVEGKDSHYIGSGLRGEGFCLHTMGKDVDAITALDASLRYKTTPEGVEASAVARGMLGQLLVDTGRDRPRGLAMARDSLAKLHELKSNDPIVPLLEAWSKRQP